LSTAEIAAEREVRILLIGNVGRPGASWRRGRPTSFRRRPLWKSWGWEWISWTVRERLH